MNPITFHTPPNWPDPPTGFLPGPDWRPDPAWGPAPQGFQFYSDPFGYPTPPPPENWQPWTSTDWSVAGAMPLPRVLEQAGASTGVQTVPAPVRRRPRWLPWAIALLVLALVGVGGWFGWQQWKPKPAVAPHDVTSLKPLYEPPLAVGTARYQFGDDVPVKTFEGSDACIAKANAATGVAKQAVAAGSDRGWTAVTWRYADTAAAQKGWTALVEAVNGCTAKDYRLDSPTRSRVADQRWVQYNQTDKDGADHGRVVITSDANTVTYIEGGRTDMGETAFQAIRKRLATMK